MKQIRLNNIDCLVKESESAAKKALFIFHGYGASMYDLAPLADVLDPEGQWDWYFPNGILEVPIGPMMSGRAWFPIDMARYEQALSTNQIEEIFLSKTPEGLKEAMIETSKLIEEVASKYDELSIGGFSQGSMLSNELTFNSDFQFQKLVLLSTTVTGEEHMKEMLKSKHSPAIFQSHGTGDPILPYSLSLKVKELLEESNRAPEFHQFEGGHEIPPNVIQALSAFLKK